MFSSNILLISYMFLFKNSIMSTFLPSGAFSLLLSWSIKRLVRNTDQKHSRLKWYRITDTFCEYRKYRYFCKYRWFRYFFESLGNGRVSRVEGHRSRVEGHRSRVESRGRGSKVEGRNSRVENGKYYFFINTFLEHNIFGICCQNFKGSPDN
jgi:hypothetical protein